VYVPCRVALVVLAGASVLDALSALIAADWVGAPAALLLDASFDGFPKDLLAPLEPQRFSTGDELSSRLAERTWDRVRVVGPNAPAVAPRLDSFAPSVESGDVSDSGYVELRRYVVEQSRSVARHRHGNMSLPLALRSVQRPPTS
jgi:hypothetical protein